jgi:arabinogalactan endo-1,4-beta-galactosidase
LAVERFDEGIEGWGGFADEGAISEVSWDPDGKLVWSIQTGTNQAAALVNHWPDLSKADGLTVHIASLNRSAFVALGVHEADGSVYSLFLPLDKDVYADYTVDFSGFGLQLDSEDENGRLDPEQLTTLTFVDISSYLASPNPNQVLIDEIALWKGAPEPQYSICTRSDSPEQKEGFRVGVDANFISQGEQLNHGFWVGQQRVDPLELFVANGANSFRLRLWVGEEGESKLNYATELAQRAQQAGLKPYVVLFLTEGWADVNKQPAPVAWADLPINERADAIQQYCYETTQHFLNQGIKMDFYEIGNEIDYGICGIFGDTSHPRDVVSLRNDIWADEASLIQAAIEGVKKADPEAHILLHIASSWDPVLASAFFGAMVDFGVDYDYMGLSYYPSAFGVVAASRLCKTLDILNAEIGKPIIIAETAYPAEPPSGGLFGDWRRALPGYPLTPEGQAWWLSDMLKGMRSRGDVLGVYVFSPGFWFSGDLWGPFALFDSEGNARPAIVSFEIER